MFLLVDLKSFAIFKVDVRAKHENGRAFRRIVTSEGVHKLPYKCTVYADGCGSMLDVHEQATSLGLD